MPGIYYNIDGEKHRINLQLRRFKNLKNALEEKESELSIGADKGSG